MGPLAPEVNEVFEELGAQPESAFSSSPSSRSSSYSLAEEATPTILLFPQFDTESFSLPFYSLAHLSASNHHTAREEPDPSNESSDLKDAVNKNRTTPLAPSAASPTGTLSAEPAPSPRAPGNPHASPPLVPILKTSFPFSENPRTVRERSVTFAETEQVRAISRRRRTLRFRSTLRLCRSTLARWFWV
ncbi:hypothetical protein T484DRAFT_1812282 [Baffinella frigidus]|nr:hypothetical protein T484DRAFT_1812282 [Cryptophyta sp. CCMP2293]